MNSYTGDKYIDIKLIWNVAQLLYIKINWYYMFSIELLIKDWMLFKHKTEFIDLENLTFYALTGLFKPRWRNFNQNNNNNNKKCHVLMLHFHTKYFTRSHLKGHGETIEAKYFVLTLWFPVAYMLPKVFQIYCIRISIGLDFGSNSDIPNS